MSCQHLRDPASFDNGHIGSGRTSRSSIVFGTLQKEEDFLGSDHHPTLDTHERSHSWNQGHKMFPVGKSSDGTLCAETGDSSTEPKTLHRNSLILIHAGRKEGGLGQTERRRNLQATEKGRPYRRESRSPSVRLCAWCPKSWQSELIVGACAITLQYLPQAGPGRVSGDRLLL